MTARGSMLKNALLSSYLHMGRFGLLKYNLVFLIFSEKLIPKSF